MSQCSMCSAFVHDTFMRPSSVQEENLMSAWLRLKRIHSLMPHLLPDFIRACLNDKESPHLMLLLVEAGAVARPPPGKIRHPLELIRLWFRNRVREMGDLDQIHFFHSGGHVPQDVAISDSGKLRIRIPKDNLYD